MNLFKKFLLDCLVGVLEHFGRSIWLPWNAFGLICALLGRLLASFALSWGTFWPHFGSLGASWNAFYAQIGPSWPKIVKKVDFLNLTSGFGTQVGTQKSRKSTSKTMFFSDAFVTSIFIDILAIFDRFWTSNLDVFGLFFGLKAKTSIL